MNTLGYRFGREQRLQISDLSSNCQTFKDFQTFVNNVEIESKQLPTPAGLKELQLLIKKNPIKWVMPVRRLCMRYIEEAKIINKLHCLFLREAFRANCYFQALSVIDSQAIPTKMQSQQVQEYMFISFKLYFFMQMYSKANKKINEVINEFNKSFNVEPKQFMVITYLLFVRFYGGYVKKQVIMGAFGAEAFMSPMRGGTFSVNNSKIDHQKLAVIQNFICYATGEKYDDQSIRFYIPQEKSGLWDQLYKLGTTQSSKMRGKVTEFKSDKLQRLKTASILDRPLDKPQNMRIINLVSPMARYDTKQKCLYINHQKATDEQVNQLITKCYELNQALKQFKVVRESHFGGGLRGFGGFGGLGGLGGMGGLGGFSGMLGRGMM